MTACMPGELIMCRCMQIGIFNLWSKSIVDIRESYDQFSITDQSIEITPETHLVLRFHRKFDAVFNTGTLQAGIRT